MANVKVAINGFGRIGRLAFRQMFDAEGNAEAGGIGVSFNKVHITAILKESLKVF